eukprot:gene1871-4967_t
MNFVAAALPRRLLVGQAQLRALTSDGYLHKTSIPTYKFQNSLLKLRIPKLNETIDKYIASATPLVSAEQLESTKNLAREFATSDGAILQEKIIAENKAKYSSYISQPWFDMYLRYREPLPINMNPQLTMKDDPDPVKHDQVPRAANLIYAAVAFYRTLRDEQLQPDIYHTKPHRSQTSLFNNLVKMTPDKVAWFTGYLFGAFALDMSQYTNLFRSTRIPLPGRDQLVVFDESQARHIIIQYGHNFYKLNVLHPDGTAIPEAEIAAALADITSSPPSTDIPPLGAATTLNRDAWADLRNRIMSASSRNTQHLVDIDSALFAVCLEDMKPGSPPMTPLGVTTPNEIVEVTECMLYGTGRNRWFDKSFQLIVTRNARTAVNFEHAWGDGVAVLRFFDEIYKESIGSSPAKPHPGEQAQKLTFDFPNDITEALNKAAADFDNFRSSVELKVLQTQAMNTDLLKKYNLGVDGTLQMSFQLAYYRMFGENASTYESASTAGFKHGRTETIRSCTIQSDKFVKAFASQNTSQSEREKLMRDAIKNHAAISKQALLGGGWDRHLFALRAMAEKLGMTLPEFYNDPTYQKLAHIILSTSTLSSPALDGGGFGPVNKDCFGIGYGTNDIGVQLSVTTYKLKTTEFLNQIEKAMADMITVASGKNF